MSTLRIAVAGSSGQLARALKAQAAARGLDLVCGGRPEVDLADASRTQAFIDAVRPTLVINAAAYTAVDKAETEQEAAFNVNARGPAVLAALCAGARLPLVHISTDYVFDGSKRSPYVESDRLCPLGVYGASKAAGEAAVRNALAQHIILRTSWVYREDGANFLRTMLRLAESRDDIGVVADQRGSPTYADDLAGAILDLAPRLALADPSTPWGTYHLTNQGDTTWAGFAEAIFAQAATIGRRGARVRPITTAEYPTPARRPAYSVMSNQRITEAFGIQLLPWQDALRRCIAKLPPQ